jgi:hypothetical protein
MADYKWAQLKTVGFNKGKWEIILDDDRYLNGVQELKINKKVGDFGKVEITILLDEGIFNTQAKAILKGETTDGQRTSTERENEETKHKTDCEERCTCR